MLCRSVLPTGVRPLGMDEGFPPLPPASITLHRGSSVSTVAECLADYIREGFGADAPPVSAFPVNRVAAVT